jgi:hypothetical protein
VSVFDDITANTTDATTKHGRDIGWGWISGHTAGVLPRPAWCAIRHLWKRQQLKRRTYAGDTRKWCQGSCSID